MTHRHSQNSACRNRAADEIERARPRHADQLIWRVLPDAWVGWVSLIITSAAIAADLIIFS